MLRPATTFSAGSARSAASAAASSPVMPLAFANATPTSSADGLPPGAAVLRKRVGNSPSPGAQECRGNVPAGTLESGQKQPLMVHKILLYKTQFRQPSDNLQARFKRFLIQEHEMLNSRNLQSTSKILNHRAEQSPQQLSFKQR
jgi:hypothetical protein